MFLNFAKFTGKHLCVGVSFFNKATGSDLQLYWKKLMHNCFPVNFAKFLRTPLLWSNSGGCLCLIWNEVHTFFISNVFFKSVTVLLNFLGDWASMNCCLIHVRFTILSHILYSLSLCPWLDLDLFMSYMCDLCFILIS